MWVWSNATVRKEVWVDRRFHPSLASKRSSSREGHLTQLLLLLPRILVIVIIIIIIIAGVIQVLLGKKSSLEEDYQRLGKIVLMRLDGNGTAVASPASDSPLWRVGPLQSQSRDRSPIPLPVVRTSERDREEARRREESRRREEESEREQGRKREGKLYIRDVRSQSIPTGITITSPLLPSPNFTVGYALTSKKIKSFMQPKLEVYARYT